jgi:hypothetical protein
MLHRTSWFFATLIALSLIAPVASGGPDAEGASYAGSAREDGAKGGDTPGNARNAKSIDLCLDAGERFTKIEVYRTGEGAQWKIIAAIRVFAKQKDGEEFEVGQAGRLPKEGKPQTFVFGPNEYLTGVEFQEGMWVDNLTLKTNKRKSDTMGGEAHPLQGHNEHNLKAGEGKKIVGLRIWSTDQDIEGIQVVVGPIAP